MTVSPSTSDPFGRPRQLAAYAPDPVTSNAPNSGSVWPTRAGSDRAVLDTSTFRRGRPHPHDDGSRPGYHLKHGALRYGPFGARTDEKRLRRCGGRCASRRGRALQCRITQCRSWLRGGVSFSAASETLSVRGECRDRFVVDGGPEGALAGRETTFGEGSRSCLPRHCGGDYGGAGAGQFGLHRRCFAKSPIKFASPSSG